MDYQHFLPTEVLLYIFAFLDARTLVNNCRGVCKFWKVIIESSDVWRVQIRRLTIKNKALDSILPTAHHVYPWYMCYAICKNIFGTDLFPKGTPKYWKTQRFRNSGETNNYFSAFGAYLLGFSPPPQEIFRDVINFNLTASIGECAVYQTIDLYAHGFTKKILELHPPILISEWFTVRHNFIGFHHIYVKLYNSQWDGDHRNGYYHREMRTERIQWYEVTHKFTNYRPDVRYVTFRHEADIFVAPVYRRDREIVYREPASKMAGAKVVINLPDLIETTE